MAEVIAAEIPSPVPGPAASDAPAAAENEVPTPQLSVAQKEFIERCRLAEHAERFEDMTTIVKNYITDPANSKSELRADERNLFSIAYKSVIGNKRSAWRIIKAIEEAQTANNNVEGGTSTGPDAQRKQLIAKVYRDKISTEVREIANQVLELLDDFLIPRTKDVEAKVFFFKMKADYFRYLAEVTEEQDQADATSNAHSAYADAMEISLAHMSPTHPVRLGLFLNYSVFHYEILQNKEEAQQLAREAFDNAISELDTLSEESYKDSTLVLQLIRDNLTLWTNEQTGGTDGEEENTEPEEDSTPAAPAPAAKVATLLLEDGSATPLNIIEDNTPAGGNAADVNCEENK